MNSEEFLKRADELMETIDCWEGLDNEVLKLFALFERCHTIKHDCQELVSINYVREKIFSLLIKHPIILSCEAKKVYLTMRIEKEQMQEAMKDVDG